MPLDPNIPHQDATYKIIGAAMRVHNRMKPGLKEEHVQRDLTGEMREDGLKVYEEYHIDIYDGDRWLGRLYLDHLVDDCVIVEVKSFSHMLTNEDIAQVICYLAATGLKVAVLLNFGRKRLEYRRILPPKKLDGWQERIQRYLWRPKELQADNG